MQSVLSELDTTKFANGILYNRVLPWAHLEDFKGPDTSSAKHFEQAVYELYLASNKRKFISDELLKSYRYTYEQQNKVAVGVLLAEISIISPGAFDAEDPKMEIDTTDMRNIKFREVAGKNPYEDITVLVISPLSEKIVQKGNTPVHFVFGKPLLAVGDYIKTLQVDFGDGQWHRVMDDSHFINRDIDYVFPASGDYVLRFEAETYFGKSFKTFANILVEVEPQARQAAVLHESPVFRYRDSVDFVPYEDETWVNRDGSPVNYGGPNRMEIHLTDLRPQLDYKIFYADNHTNIQNPIIITDGFDPGNSRLVDIIYEEGLKYNDEAGKLGDELRMAGFDVIIVDFPIYPVGEADLEYRETLIDKHNVGVVHTVVFHDTVQLYRQGSVDYIEQNGKLLASFLRTINDSLVQNVGPQHNGSVLVGPSMGGLITRWALTELEQSEYDHKVRMWVSFDSPHLGANTPTALQWAVYFMERVGGMSFSHLGYMGKDALFSPAARQMLVDHLYSHTGNRISGGDPDFHTRFYRDLERRGFPQHTRRLALVNGSFMGETVGSPGERFLKLRSEAWIENNCLSSQYLFHPFDLKFYYSNSSSRPTLRYDVDEQSINNFSASVGAAVTALAGPIAGIYVASLLRNSILSDLGPEFSGYVDVDGNYGSYDVAPGGLFPHFNNLPEIRNRKLKSFDIPTCGTANIYISFSWDYNGKSFSYIPVKSSLAFTGANRRLDENLCAQYGNLVALHLTPFHSYYAPEHNENHCELTAESVDWLKRELFNGPQSPYPDGSLCVQPLAVQGPQFLCPGDQGRYYTNISGNITWSAQGMTIVSQPAPDTVIVEMNNAHGMGRITARLQGYREGYMNVFCMPDFDVTFNEDGRDIQLKPAGGTTFAEQGVTDVTWELTEGNGFLVRADNYSAEVDMQPDYYGTVTVTNPNGSTSKPIFGPEPDKCYILKKVEADKYQVIDRCSGYVPVTTMPVKEIYDQYGTKLQDAPVVNGKIDISNSGQSGDIRVIHVGVNGENVSKMIIKD